MPRLHEVLQQEMNSSSLRERFAPLEVLTLHLCVSRGCWLLHRKDPVALARNLRAIS